jgi:hypothetical protein
MELVRSIYASWARGDWSASGWAQREIEYVMADGPSPGRWIGLAGAAEGGRINVNVWEDFRMEAERVVHRCCCGGGSQIRVG